MTDRLLRIGVDATCAGISGAARTGVYQYVQQVLREVGRQCPSSRLELLFALPHPRHRRSIGEFARSLGLGNVTPHRAWLPVRHLMRWNVPVDVFTGPLDVFHAPAHLGLACRGCPTVVTVHDLAYLDDRGAGSAPPQLDAAGRAQWKTRHRFFEELARNMERSVARASRIIAVSQATAVALVARLGVDPGKVSVVHLGVRDGFRPVAAEQWRPVLERLGLAAGYLLYVGVLDPNKNLDTLLDGYALYRRHGGTRTLVIGGHSPYYRHLLECQARGLGVEGSVRFPGFLDDADLGTVYSAAHALLMPSPLEGFGLPAVESMACGTPVIAADRGALPEVVGDAGLLAQSDSAVAFSQRMLALEDPALRSRLAALGIERARGFNWQRTGAGTLAVYRAATGGAAQALAARQPEAIA